MGLLLWIVPIITLLCGTCAAGLNNPACGAVVRAAIEEARASVVCLVESKLAHVDQFVISRLLGPRFDAFVALPVVHTAGGIIVVWQSGLVQVRSSRVDTFSVTLELCLAYLAPWFFTVVYGPTLDAFKVPFLQELRMIRAACPGGWALAGDFNLIVEASDKSNDLLNRRMMGRFRRFLNDLELQEAALLGRRYTWCNERRAPTLKKIDRWFMSVEWEQDHPDHLLQALSSSLSDHCPLMLSTNVCFRRKSWFHFQSFWPAMEGFQEAVARGWNASLPRSDLFVDLSCHLQATARELSR